MARRNISIPDELDQRLDRHRDRINASRVCAIALERELDMIEEQTRPLDVDESQVEQLLERLLQQRDEKEKWYSRGRRDGEAWTRETATLNELHHFDEHWSGLEGMTVDDFNPDDLEGWVVELLPKEFRSNDLRQLPIDLQGAYIFGWREGVTNLWRVVRTRL